MNNAYHYQHTFNDEQAEEFRDILSIPFDPLHLDGLQLWLDGSDLARLTVDGSNNVSQWDDKSGNGHHAVQGTQTDQPISGQETLDDKNGIFFNYPDRHWMVSGFLPQAGDSLTTFILARRVDDSTPYGGGSVYKILLSSGRPDTAGPEVGKFNVAENRDTARLQTVSHLTNAYNSVDGQIMDGRAHIISSRLDLESDPDHVVGRADGVEEEFDDMYDTPVADDVLPFEICGSTSASTRRFWGTIFEVLIYDKPLSDEDILKVELYLAEKWHTYHPLATWIQNYDAVTQAAIHAGKLSRDDITTTNSPLLLWLDADDAGTITKDGGDLVSQWDDKSPHGHDVTQAASSAQPTYDFTGLEGKPALTWESSTSKYLQYLSFPHAENIEVLTVAKATSNASSHNPFVALLDEWLIRLETTNLLAVFSHDGTDYEPRASGTPNTELNRAYLMGGNFDGATLTALLSGVSVEDQARPEAINTGAGTLHVGVFGGSRLDGCISEIVVYDKKLDDTSRKAVEVYLADKWGVYHPDASWPDSYDAVTKTAIHTGQLNQSEISSTKSPLILWLDAADSATITMDTSNQVSQWDDKSPHGNDVVQGTANLQPTYRKNGVGQNLASVEFYADGTPKLLTTPDAASMDYSDATVIAVIQRRTDLASIEVMFGKYETTGDQREFNGNISSDTFRVSSSTDGTLGGLITTSTTNAIALGVPTIVDMKYDGSSLRIRSQDDGANEATAATTIFNGTSPFKLGAVSSTIQPYGGHIAELIFFNTVISDADRDAILTYLSTKWGIPL